MREYNFIIYMYDLLNMEGICIFRILIFRDKIFNSGKFCYFVLKFYFVWNC